MSNKIVDTSQWMTKRIQLKYKLGEITVYTARFEMAGPDFHFTACAEDEINELPTEYKFPEHIDGVLIRSQPLSAHLPRITFFPNYIRFVPFQYHRHFIEVKGTFADYLQKFSSQSRSKRRKEVKLFGELSGGVIDLREYRTPTELQNFLNDVKELLPKTFQVRLLDVGLPNTSRFRERLMRLAATGKIRAYMLFVADKPVSYLLSEIRDPDILILQNCGYDPVFRANSPGTVLWYKAFETIFDEGSLHIIDLTEGEGTHKKFFATGSTLCADVYFFRRSFLRWIQLYIHGWLDSYSLWTVSALDRLGIKARVKKLVRAWA